MRSVTDSGPDRYAELDLTDREWQSISESLRPSTRQSQITRRILKGQKEAQIAEALGISTHTLHKYLMRLYRKLDVGDRCELVLRVFAAYVSAKNRETCGPPTQRDCLPTTLPN